MMPVIRDAGTATFHGVVAALLTVCWCTHANAQAAPDASLEIRRDPNALLRDVQVHSLRAGGEIKHDRFGGLIRRYDGDLRLIALIKVPKADLIEKSTTLVLAANQSRLLMIHQDSSRHFPARHKVALLDVATLKTLSELPLGECRDPSGSFPIVSGQLTLVCYHSRPPDQPKRRPTFALVTLNLDRGQVVRWFPLEGQRHGSWFGPMFFGYSYDVTSIPVEQSVGSCPEVAAKPALDAPDQPVEYPQLVIVLSRSKGDTRGEVWFVSAATTIPPRRVGTLAENPTSAVVCEADRKLLFVMAHGGAAGSFSDRAAGSFSERIVEVFDLSTGARIAR